MKKSRNDSFHLISFYGSTLITIFVFLLSTVVTITNIKFDSDNIRQALGDFESKELFVYFIKAENHYFMSDINNDLFTFGNLSNLAFHLFTNIKPTDARTFLSNELPGLRLYDTKIVVAGEGTNITNLPYESTPPTEVLLKEREVAEEKLIGLQNEATENITPSKLPDKQSVFIYQTHSWESFLPLLQDATNPNDAISSDTRVNVIGLGERLSNNLISKGIGVIQDKTNMTTKLKEKNWKTTKAYSLSGHIVEEAAATVNNNSLQYFIDIHRDSARKDVTTKNINGENYARLYFIVGKEHQSYEHNLNFAKALNDKLEKKYPGISRGVFLKTKSQGNGVYNQDVSDKAILIEIGGVDNDLEELGRTIDVFSEVFADYYWEEENSAKEVNGNG